MTSPLVQTAALLSLLAAPAVGSFIGLASLRMPAGGAVVAGRSACAGCGRTLGVGDLAPIVSFLALRGRCRTCRAAIPRRYLALELGCLGLAAWAFAVHPLPLAIAGALLAWQIVLLAVLDAEHFWLPRKLTLALVASGLAVAALQGLGQLSGAAIGAAAGFLSLSLLAFGYRRLRGREGLGGGDAYMLAGAGAWVGWQGLPTVLLWASIAGLSVAAAGWLTGRGMKLDQRLPFGVFLAIGAWLTWLYGPVGL
jgi:leader peptidase (prepilin peptidase)/N-methyltransferase